MSVTSSFGAVGGEPAGDARADLSQPDDRDPPARGVRGPERPLERHPDRGANPDGRRLGGLAGASLRFREAVRVPGPLARDQHVLRGRAHVLAHAVASAERVNRVAEVEHRRAPPLGRELGIGRQRDHALAAAEREPGQRALQRHRLRKCKRVIERLAPISVAPQATAPDGLTQCGRMDRDDHGQRRALADRDRYPFVLEHLDIVWIDLTVRLPYRHERPVWTGAVRVRAKPCGHVRDRARRASRRPQAQSLDVVRVPADRRSRAKLDVPDVRDLIAGRGAGVSRAPDPRTPVDRICPDRGRARWTHRTGDLRRDRRDQAAVVDDVVRLRGLGQPDLRAGARGVFRGRPRRGHRAAARSSTAELPASAPPRRRRRSA